jgi:uncharacterized protein YgbK (DUF1537 family)
MRTTYGFLADDLTGASDVLAQAHAHGLSAMLVLDPADVRADAADVVGIAGPARSLSGDELDAEVRGGLSALRKLDLDVLLYKVCSTFDSSPTVGSIGRALEILAETYPDHGPVPVVPAQPGFGRYTAFSQHFGVYGGTVHRLDRHPVMQHHPSTPMTEADLRLVLAEQLASGEVPDALHLPAFADDTFDARWSALRQGSGTAFVVDAVTEEHLDSVSRALPVTGPPSGPALVVGSGGIMAALARTRTGQATTPPGTQRSTGPTLVVSASASRTTAAQIDDAVAHGFVDVAIPAAAFGAEPDETWQDVARAALEAGHDVVAHTSRGPEDARLSSGATADEVGGAIGRFAGRMARAGLTRDVAVCGGDTSSHALAALEVRELRVQNLFVTAGPVCAADDDSAVAGCRLLLKGGQVGPPSILRDFAGHAREAN